MQRRSFILLATGSLVLSACSGGLLGGPQSGPDVSGSLLANSGGTTWPSATRLALIGVNESGTYNNGSQAQIADTTLAGGYTTDLPKTTDQGLYRVIAYVDGTGGQAANGTYDLGETVSDSNGKFLVYSNQAFTAFGKTFGAGWTLYNTADGTSSPASSFPNGTFTGYDLTYPSGQ